MACFSPAGSCLYDIGLKTLFLPATYLSLYCFNVIVLSYLEPCWGKEGNKRFEGVNGQEGPWLSGTAPAGGPWQHLHLKRDLGAGEGKPLSLPGILESCCPSERTMLDCVDQFSGLVSGSFLCSACSSANALSLRMTEGISFRQVLIKTGEWWD